MDEKLTWEQIKERYNEQWVLLEDYDWPMEQTDPRSGTVRFHAPSREEFDILLEKNEDALGDDIALVYVGSPRVKSGIGYRHVEVKLHA